MNKNLYCLVWLGFVIFSNAGWAKVPKLKPGEVVLLLNAPEIDPQSELLEKDGGFPRNWRTSDDPFKSQARNSKLPTRLGLSNLHISGSSEFSKMQFRKILQEFSLKKILVMDLRQESHGFLNGLAVSWYGKDDAANYGKNLQGIESDESQRLSGLMDTGLIGIGKWVKESDSDDNQKLKWIGVEVNPKSAMTEKDLVSEFGTEYFRIPVQDHLRPRDEDVDRFITKYRTLDSNYWVHFHCAAGIGRTTTFMVMYDMMKNAEQVSAEDIILRQALIGGANLMHLSKTSKKKYNEEKDRITFLQKFYEYCKSQGPSFNVLWSDWLTQTAGAS